MKTLAESFWPRVRIGTPDECWEWTARQSANGYGLFRNRNAHRTAWELANGPIPKGGGYHGTCVCHRCDNRRCCNPAHLFLGTHRDNMRDMAAKGRHVKGAQPRPEQRPRGETHWSHRRPELVVRGDCHGSRLHPERRPRGAQQHFAKLNDANVAEIRVAYAAGGVSQTELARRYGVSQSTISFVVLRKAWRHVSDGGDRE